ncbi:MAG TPA: SDR family NAD(P)-dependent oxidoreductase [Ramlibacter sp.]|nr:SDR family NAD(P)-dependent oxidoreductase [Ramlibacter sp.]
MDRFTGKTIVVTGAGSGIGAACVRRLHAEGASVVAADLRKQDVDKLAAEIGDGGRIHAAELDVSNRDAVVALIADAGKRFGNLYGLVNSAGIRGVGNVLDFEEEAWRRVLAVNLDGTFHACQAFARALRDAKAPGAIVNITSGAGIVGIPNRLGYSASKFAVSGITKSMSLELASLGIRVNAVAPGMIRTPMTSTMFQDPDNVRKIRAAHPIGREGEPEDVAAAICFLLSSDAAFITGVVLPVDGGNTVGIPSF